MNRFDFKKKCIISSSLAFVSSLSSASLPLTWQDALCDPKWKDAMMAEINALKT